VFVRSKWYGENNTLRSIIGLNKVKGDIILMLMISPMFLLISLGMALPLFHRARNYSPSVGFG